MFSLVLAPLFAVLAVPIDARAVPNRRADPPTTTPGPTSTTSSASALATSIPAGWSAQACIAEGTSGRALASAMISSDSMTWNQCITYCANAGFSMAGVEFGRECFCSNILQNGAALSRTSNNCNYACTGSSTSTCGGPAALQLFVSQQATSSLNADLNAPKAAAALPAGWSAASTPCIAEGTSGRALNGASLMDDGMTVSKCLNYCQTKGFQYAGVEYGKECYCGRDIASGASLSSPSNQCNMMCGGDSLASCGGPNALQLYQNPSYAVSNPMVDGYNGYRYQGCIQEVSGRALVGKFADQTDMTVETCIGSCYRAGYAYAALEYGSQCFCASGLANGASLSNTSNQCNMPCAGNRYEVCGGPNAVQLYKTTKFKASS